MLSGDVTTFHDDNSRTGANTEETTLTPANVNSTDFGKIDKSPTDGKVDAQPLYVSNVAIPGQGTHDVLYVATENDSLYAFDANTGAVLWHDGPSGTPTSLLGPNETAVPTAKYFPGQGDPEIGILSTPVIDTTTNTIYLVAESVDVPGPADLLSSGSTRSTSGPGGRGHAPLGRLLDHATRGRARERRDVRELQPRAGEDRAGLALSNGVVYVGLDLELGRQAL